MSSKKKILENSILYTLSSLLVKALGFLMLPLYTYFLTPEDYGVVNLANSFIQVMIFLISFSMYSAAVRFYADYKEDKEKLKNFYSSMINTILITGAVFTVLGLYFNDFLSNTFLKGIDGAPIIVIALLTTTFLSLYTMHQKILQGMQLGRYLTLLNIITFLATLLIKVFLIVVLKLGAEGFLLAQLIINVAYSIFMLIDLRKKSLYEVVIQKDLLKEALVYSIPLVPHNLSNQIASFFSRVVLSRSNTMSSVGLYSIAMQYGALIDMIQTSVNRAFQPWFYEMMNKGDESSKKETVEFSYMLLVGYSFIYMTIGLFSQEVILLMTEDSYLEAWRVIPIFVVGYSIKSLYFFFANVITYDKKAVRKLFLSTLIGSLADVILAFILIPRFGMNGAALAFVIAKLVVVMITIYISKVSYDIGYKVTRMAAIIIPSLVFMGAGLYFSYTTYGDVFSWMNIIYKISIFHLYILFIYITNKKSIHKLLISRKVHQKVWRRIINGGRQRTKKK